MTISSLGLLHDKILVNMGATILIRFELFIVVSHKSNNKLFSHGKFIDTTALILLSRLQQCGGPFRLVRRIGIFLCFQTDRGTTVIYDTFLTFYRSVQEVAGIELKTWLVGINIKYNAGLR